MAARKTTVTERVKKYHFELKHLLVLLGILIFFQVFVSFVHKTNLQRFLLKSQEWYQRDYAEKLANLTATSLEMLLETSLENRRLLDEASAKKIVQAFNILLSQQLVQHHVEDVCLLFSDRGKIIPIDSGQQLYSYFFRDAVAADVPAAGHAAAVQMYRQLQEKLVSSEQIISILKGTRTFHVFVPFVPRGEYVGALYIRYKPDFGFVTSGIVSSYNEISLVFTALIFFGLLAMFYISSYTVRERDRTQQLLFEARERQLKEKIHLQKEALFAKRIYHTHHKAEKVMGFIKEDIRALSPENIGEIKYRISKYANFISRVIYDMKAFDPPIQAIRNPLFRTDLNELIRFIVENIFQRVSSSLGNYSFELDLDENFPPVSVNEFVAWEIIEPLIQNSIDHAGGGEITIHIRSRFEPERNRGMIFIGDNGKGIAPELLQEDEHGVKKIFRENVSTKNMGEQSGYGCYIAYEMAVQRCGWHLDAENLEKGCQFIITIPLNPAMLQDRAEIGKLEVENK